MSEWTWEYVPDAASVVGGLTGAQLAEVEDVARRIADAVAVRRIGTPLDIAESVSNIKSHGEGPVMIWFLEDYRDDIVLIVRVQGLAMPGHTTARQGATAPRSPDPQPLADHRWFKNFRAISIHQPHV
jgi:hypothetical protein